MWLQSNKITFFSFFPVTLKYAWKNQISNYGNSTSILNNASLEKWAYSFSKWLLWRKTICWMFSLGAVCWVSGIVQCLALGMHSIQISWMEWKYNFFIVTLQLSLSPSLVPSFSLNPVHNSWHTPIIDLWKILLLKIIILTFLRFFWSSVSLFSPFPCLAHFQIHLHIFLYMYMCVCVCVYKNV